MKHGYVSKTNYLLIFSALITIITALSSCDSRQIRHNKLALQTRTFRSIAVISPDVVYIQEYLTKSKTDTQKGRDISRSITADILSTIKAKGYYPEQIDIESVRMKNPDDTATLINNFSIELNECMENRYYKDFFNRHDYSSGPLNKTLVTEFNQQIGKSCDGILFIEVRGTQAAGAKSAGVLVLDLLAGLSTGSAHDSQMRISIKIALIDTRSSELIFLQNIFLKRDTDITKSIHQIISQHIPSMNEALNSTE